jgi:quinol monooxygenase YgiN
LAEETATVYGLIGNIKCKSGKRDEVVVLMTAMTRGGVTMAGCLSYVIALDMHDAGALWITEAWESRAAQKAWLEIPSVKDSIHRALPMIDIFDQHLETEPLEVI